MFASGVKLVQLNIEIFGGCNYRCPMCPQRRGRERDFLKRMPFEVFRKIVDDAMQYGPEAISLHGSGEAMMHPQLLKFVRFAASRGLRVSIFTNGSRLSGSLFRELGDAGMSLVTISIVGHDRTLYAKWMGADNSAQMMANLRECRKIMSERPGGPVFHTRHLICDAGHVEEEVGGYRRNWIEPLDCRSEIWLMHNWSGSYETAQYARSELTRVPTRRTCGRPFAPTLEVRAGGPGVHTGAVVPCPFVLGRDSEAVLGTLDTQTIAEALTSPAYEQLRQMHREDRWDEVSYCRGCDQLYEVPEALVWTNIRGRFYGQSKTANFDYREFTT